MATHAGLHLFNLTQTLQIAPEESMARIPITLDQRMPDEQLAGQRLVNAG